jgi:hypothetical protein
MPSIISGVALFIVVVGLLLKYRQWSNRSYSSHPGLFTLWYIGWIIVCVLILKFPWLIICIASIVALLYLAFLGVWKSVSSGTLKYVESIPGPFKELSQPTVWSAVPKTLEIFIQDVAAWLIVGGLCMYFTQWWMVAILFSSVVYALHIPGIKMFGPVYGRYFLYTSTTFAFVVPLVYQFGYLGFCFVYGVHIFGYVVMYLVFLKRR